MLTACVLLPGAKNGNAAGMRSDIVLKDVNVNPNSAYHREITSTLHWMESSVTLR